MDVLFFTVSTGSGHIKAAEAVMECIGERSPGSRTLIVDTFKYINPLVDRIIVGGYLETVKHMPKIYGRLYGIAETSERLTNICKRINMAFSEKLCGMIDSFRPSVIVCTHTVPLHMLSYLKSRGKVDVPVAAIVTDFTNHLFWKLDNIDTFIVPHEYIARDMVDMGLPAENIADCGIPVKKKFLARKEKKLARLELGLEDRTTILIMGGSMGLGEVPAVFRALLQSRRNLQLVVVAGSNRRLKRELELCKIPDDKKVRILGYTDQIPEYMDASDLIITKPGGMTVSEALIKSLPLAILSPLPGQEERNSKFLLLSGASVMITPGKEIDPLLYHILDNSARLKQMKDAARSLARPFAAEEVTDILERLVYGEQKSGEQPVAVEN